MLIIFYGENVKNEVKSEMDEKKHCKWYNDEFCTNGDSPCVADYCPVVEYPELCKCRETEFAKDINVRSKLTDDARTFVALFVEFDEMGFAPTTTCPNPEEFAKAWKMAMLTKIHRLQDENKRLTEDNELKTAQVALLTGQVEFLKNCGDNFLSDCEKLQKQVDELNAKNSHLDSENTRLICEMDRMLDEGWDIMDKEAEICHNRGYAQAVKDTAEKFAKMLKEKLEERKNICLERWKRYEKEGETNLACYWNGKENEIYCVKADIYEICKQITEGDK